MEHDKKSVKMTLKKDNKIVLPAGSTILSKSVDVDVEEIENGYLITKRTEVKYQAKGKEYSDYTSCCKKYYTKECPIKTDNKNKELADLFE